MNENQAPYIKKFIDVMTNSNCLKVMYYLKEFNPDVTAKGLADNLDIENETLSNSLSKLVELNLVKQNDNKFSLTIYGRLSLNRLEKIQKS